MKIYELFHTVDAPTVFATPSHSAFVAEVLPHLKTLERGASIPPLQMGDPDQISQGFFNLSNSVLVFKKKTLLEPIGDALEFAGNLHPTMLNDTGEELYFLNVTARYNCLDRSRTTLHSEASQIIKTPAFFPDLLGESCLFRLPQLPASIFVATGGKARHDFYTLYKESGMRELKFEFVWEG